VTAQLPVIMITERETAREHGEAKALGVVGCLEKPLNVVELEMPVMLALRARGITPMAQRSGPQARQAANAPRAKIKGSIIVFETDDDEYKTISSVLQYIRFHPRRITVFSTARLEFVSDPPRMVILGHGFARDGERILLDISGYPGADSSSIIPISNPEYPGTYANAFSMGTRQVVDGPVKTEQLMTAVERAWDAYVSKAKRVAQLGAPVGGPRRR
jgi:DNA-binding response OmpR family regulator